MHLLSSFSLGLSLFAAQSRAIAILQPASTVSEMGLLLDLVPRQCDGFACCTKAVEKPAYDDKGKAYGFENGKSCVGVI